jgi:hypothetical protein
VSIEDLARRAVVERVVADKVKASQADTKAALMDAMEVGDRKVAKIGDTSVGYVIITKGRQTWRVSDPAALLAWVKANMPTEVVVTESVRESYVTALLNGAKAAGAPVDPRTGEVVPGIEVAEGDPYASVRPNEAAEVAVAEAWNSGELDLWYFAELEAGA